MVQHGVKETVYRNNLGRKKGVLMYAQRVISAAKRDYRIFVLQLLPPTEGSIMCATGTPYIHTTITYMCDTAFSIHILGGRPSDFLIIPIEDLP